jgi:hypothetical protein
MMFWIIVLELHSALWNVHFLIGVKLLFFLEKLQIMQPFDKYLQADLFLGPQIHAAITRFNLDMVLLISCAS